MLFYFAHYLQGKNAKNYNAPVVKTMEFVKEICANQVDPKNLTTGEGKRMKKLRRAIEEKYIEHFRQNHFGILPLTKDKLYELCAR